MIGSVLTMAAGAAAPPPAFASEGPETFVTGNITIDVLANGNGGKRTDTRMLGLATLGAGANDLGDGPVAASSYVELQWAEGSAFSDEVVGDSQVISNIEAASAFRALEAWVELTADDGRHRLKAGPVDLNREFDRQEVGSLFLNSSHGIGPEISQSGANGPSIFPTTTTAVIYGLDAGDWGLRTGAFNALAGDPESPGKTVVPLPGEDGVLLIAEAERTFETGRAYFGAWAYSTVAPLPGGAESGAGERWRSRGTYAAIEATLVQVPAGATLDGWARVGFANADVLPVGTYFGGGLRYGTPDHAIGLAVAHARLGDSALDAADLHGQGADRAETNIELSYLRSLAPGVSIQPDIQYVLNPGWDPAVEHALVVGLRFSVDFL